MRFNLKKWRPGIKQRSGRKSPEIRRAAWQVFQKDSGARQFVAERLESRTFLTATPIAIVNPGFETLYEPGTDVIAPNGQITAGSTTATVVSLPGGAGTFSAAPFGPNALLRYQVNGDPQNPSDTTDGGYDIATVKYSDGTQGNYADVAGWTAPAFPATYGGVVNVSPQIDAGGNASYEPFPGKTDNVLYLNGPGATKGSPPYALGPGYQVVSQQLGTDVQPNTLYTLSVQVGLPEGDSPNALAVPVIANVEVGGTPLTLLSSNEQQVEQAISVNRTDPTPGSGSFSYAFNDPAIPAAVQAGLTALAQGANIQSGNINTFEEYGQTYYYPANDITIMGSDGVAVSDVKIAVDAAGNPVGPGTFQTLTETFYTGSTVPANTPLTVTLGTGPQSTASALQTCFDNVSLTSAPQASATVVTAAIAPPATITAQNVASQTISVTYSSTAAPISPNAVEELSITGAPAAGGTFKLSYDGTVSGAITYSADAPTMAGNIQSALDALVSGGFVVTSAGTTGSTASFDIAFQGNIPFVGTQLTPVIDSGRALSGASVTLSLINEGINPQDVTIVGPSGDTLPATANSSTYSVNADGSVTATYTIAAPDGGSFTSADNGTYTVLVAPGSATDAAGNTLGFTAPVTFSVQVPVNATPALISGSNVSVGFTSEAVFAEPDGTTVIAGHDGYPFDFTSGSQAEFEIVPSGSTNGQTFTPSLGDHSAFFGAAVVPQGLPDAGDIVAVGTEGGDMVVARYNPDGSPDTSFGSGGVFLAGINGDSAAYSVAIDPSGKIVVAGTNSNGDYVFFRLNSNGTPDVSFNPGGLNDSRQPLASGASILLPLQGAFFTAHGGELRISSGQGGNAIDQIVLEPNADGVKTDYNILAVGTASTFIDDQTVASKVLAVLDVVSTGAADTAFGLVNGQPTGLPNLVLKSSLPIPGLALIPELIPGALGSDAAKNPIGIALQSDGDIVVVAGAADPTTASQTDFGVARLDALGNLDPTFGTPGVGVAGIAYTPFQTGGQAFANSVSITGQAGTSAERIVVFGVSYGTAGFESAFAVYTQTGQLDTSFNSTGTSPGTLLTPSGMTDSRAFYSGNGTSGETLGAINGDGSATFSTSDPDDGSTSTTARIQFVSPFPQLAASEVTATTNTDTTPFEVVYTSKAGFDVNAATIPDSLVVTDVINGVAGPSLTATEAPGQTLANAQTVDVFYNLTAPGDWTTSDAGIIHVALGSDANVLDTEATPAMIGTAGAEFGTFQLNVNTAAGTQLQLGAVTGSIPATAIGQTRFSTPLHVLVTNVSGQPFNQFVVLTLSDSLVNNTVNGDTLQRSITTRLSLATGASKTLTLRGLIWPSTPGNYYLLASATAPGVNGASLSTNIGATATTVQVTQPFIDLANEGATLSSSTLVNGRNFVYVTLDDVGNIPANGSGTVEISIANLSDSPKVNIPINAHLAVGKIARIRVPFLGKTLAATGPVELLVNVALSQDADTANNSAVTPVVTPGK